jgi:putative membrane protein
MKISQKLYNYIIFTLFLVVWTWSSYHPASSQNWFLENKLIFATIPIIICTVWFLKLSRLSVTLITLFLILHLIGAHYNYGSVPFGQTIGEWLKTDRNMYDRLVHFSFGFLMFYPIRELFLRIANVKTFWSYYLPFDVVLSFSAIYEIMEWFTVRQSDPHVGYLFIGGTDPFDASKDMAMAGIGALLALIIIFILQANLTKNFWKKLKRSVKHNEDNFEKEDAFLHPKL